MYIFLHIIYITYCIHNTRIYLLHIIYFTILFCNVNGFYNRRQNSLHFFVQVL